MLSGVAWWEESHAKGRRSRTIVAMEVVGVQGDFEKKKMGLVQYMWADGDDVDGQPDPSGMKLNLFRPGPGPTRKRLN